MIVKKYWRKYRKDGKHSDRMGYFLFGFIPVFMEVHPWISY